MNYRVITGTAAAIVMMVVASFAFLNASQIAHADEEPVPASAGVSSAGVAPIIECKWELPDVEQIVGSNGIQYGDDDDPLQEPGFPCARGDGDTDRPQMADNVQNVIQVLPNAEDLPEARKIENWVAVEHPNGVDEIDDVFWKVIHPDGSFKLQVHGTKVEIADLGDLGSPSTPGTMWYAAHETGQVTDDAITATDFGIVDLVTQRQKDLWYAEWEISKEQMCGLYTVEVTAVANGAVATMTNTLDIRCFFNLEIDFDEINWGTITPGGAKVLPGDTNFGTAGYPTVKNTGNSGMRVGIEFSELVQDDVLGPKVIDTFDAAFGKSAQVLEWIDPIPADTEVWFSDSSINQVLCANEVGKLDLSIHPPPVVPVGSYSGTVTVLAQWAPGVCWERTDGIPLVRLTENVTLYRNGILRSLEEWDYDSIVSPIEFDLIALSHRDFDGITEQELLSLGDRLVNEYGDHVCIQKDGVILVSLGIAQCLPYPSGPGNIAIAAGPTSKADASGGYGNIAIAADAGDAVAADANYQRGVAIGGSLALVYPELDDGGGNNYALAVDGSEVYSISGSNNTAIAFDNSIAEAVYYYDFPNGPGGSDSVAVAVNQSSSVIGVSSRSRTVARNDTCIQLEFSDDSVLIGSGGERIGPDCAFW